MCIAIQAGTGCFELCLNNKIILSGNIFIFDELNFNPISNSHNGKGKSNPIVTLSGDEVYSSIEQFGYCVGDVFKTIKYVNIFEDGMYCFSFGFC